MALFTTLDSLSQTASSNAADGSVDAPSTVDNQLNLLASFIAQLRDGSGLSYLPGDRNKIINGNFGINQRAVSGAVTLAAGAYGHDRWKAGASGCTYTFSTSNNVTTITISAGSLQQVIEGSSLLSGTHTLSWTGTAQGRVDSGAYGASGLTGTATGGTNQTVEFNTGTVSQVQYEQGSTATSFALRSPQQELALCQRYYEKSYDSTVLTIAGAHQSVASTGSMLACAAVRFAVTKRTATVAIVYISPIDGTSGAIGEYNTSGAAVTNRTPTLVGALPTGFLTVTASATVGNQVFFHWTASAEL